MTDKTKDAKSTEPAVQTQPPAPPAPPAQDEIVEIVLNATVVLDGVYEPAGKTVVVDAASAAWLEAGGYGSVIK